MGNTSSDTVTAEFTVKVTVSMTNSLRDELRLKGEDLAFTPYVDDLQNQIAGLDWAQDTTVAFEETE
ncbi:hypothetical protein ACFVWF_32930 [Rhodococcus qingshengii]|uniref:hypothetical protein n=1 Tax=Rhodococcus qingshengii TaxID=334542 RepID=UPI0036DAB847